MSRGRPPGHGNRSYRILETTKPRCPTCGCTSFTNRQQTETLEYGGMAPDGQPFDRVCWASQKCTNCGQWLKVIEHHKLHAET